MSIWPKMLEMIPMTIEPPKPDRLWFFRQFDYLPPMVLDSRRLVIMKSDEEWLREALELIDEIELNVCNRAIAAMYLDVGGEG